MAWQRAGTVSIAAGSTEVTGTGTAFTLCAPGDAIVFDGDPTRTEYEITGPATNGMLNSDTALTLHDAYTGPAIDGGTYAIKQFVSNTVNGVLAARINTLLQKITGYVSGALSGLFGDGTRVAPSIGFAAETTTGWFRPAAGMVALAIQGIEQIRFGAGSAVGLGSTPRNWDMAAIDIAGSGAISGTPTLTALSYNLVRSGGTWSPTVAGQATALQLVSAGNHAFLVGTGSELDQIMNVTKGGVGIGNGTALAPLHIIKTAPTTTINEQIRLYNDFTAAGVSEPGITFTNSTDADPFTGQSQTFGLSASVSGQSYIRCLYKGGGDLVELFRVDNASRMGLGTLPSPWEGSSPALDIGSASLWSYMLGSAHLACNSYFNNSGWQYKADGPASYYSQLAGVHTWTSAPPGEAGDVFAPITLMNLDPSGGYLTVGAGATAGAAHGFYTSVGEGSPLAEFSTIGVATALFISSVGNNSWGTMAAAVNIGKNTVTSRSLGVAGNISSPGDDYAEYRELTPALYGKVSAGTLLGYDASGLMTNVFANVVGRVLPKSSSPSYVGGDTWGAEAAIVAAYGVAAPGASPAVVTQPTPPAAVQPPGDAPAVVAAPAADATPDALAAYVAYQTAASAHTAAAAAYAAYQQSTAAYAAQQAACTKYQADLTAYQARVTAFNAALETERVKWDRIALCGVVPVNIQGLTAADVGKHLIPSAAADGTITATVIAKADLTLGQYIDSFGTIEKIGADGRPLVNVKNG